MPDENEKLARAIIAEVDKRKGNRNELGLPKDKPLENEDYLLGLASFGALAPSGAGGAAARAIEYVGEKAMPSSFLNGVASYLPWFSKTASAVSPYLDSGALSYWSARSFNHAIQSARDGDAAGAIAHSAVAALPVTMPLVYSAVKGVKGTLLRDANGVEHPLYDTAADPGDIPESLFDGPWYKKHLSGETPVGIYPSSYTAADEGVVKEIPEVSMGYIRNTSYPRMAQYRPKGFEESANRLFNEKVKYVEFPGETFDKAGLGHVAGIAYPSRDRIVTKTGTLMSAERKTLPHELRHILDGHYNLSPEEQKMINSAYGDDFIKSLENSPKFKDYKGKKQELVTTNFDIRRSLLDDYTGGASGLSLEEQNKIIENASDLAVKNAIENSNGYGKVFLEYLTDNGLWTKERIRAIKDALIGVGGIAGIGILNSAETSTSKKFGGLIEKYGADALRNTLASGGKIHIKPSHRGRLTELKARTGKTEAELYNDGNPAHKKMVVFARNSRKWSHADGGLLETPEKTEYANKWDSISNARYGMANDALNRSGSNAQDSDRLARILAAQSALEAGWVDTVKGNNFAGYMSNGKRMSFDTADDFWDYHIKNLDERWPDWRKAQTVEDYYNIVNNTALGLTTEKLFREYNRNHRDNPAYIYAPDWENENYLKKLQGIYDKYISTYVKPWFDIGGALGKAGSKEKLIELIKKVKENKQK